MNKKTYLKDYTQPNFWISKVDLSFDIFSTQTIVTQKSLVTKNLNQKLSHSQLELHGEDLELISLLINGKVYPDYEIKNNNLILKNLDQLNTFNLEIKTKIYPHKNLQLSGLYKSGDLLCTQCEAEGFRRITYFLDRPDNMAIFTVCITADKKKYPVLLSNGNKIKTLNLANNRQQVFWHDPFKKPSYLFALVAGDLDVIQDNFITKSQKKITLEIYSEKNKSHLCYYAMECLKKAIKWDEDTYNLEYDLDQFMIVAVDDFNMGAMENKGLNIFNSSVILSNAEMATDSMLNTIESIIGHEYFHNWSGNRVTCRDWFQLSLKEGLTVYRDQEFSADLNGKVVQRIEDVKNLRTHQFAEDAGVNAHPVRPSSYLSIDNFYSATIYEKGAELIRMLQLILGEKIFKSGVAYYFNNFDGSAATIEDFLFSMQKVSTICLKQFKTWYKVSGTPVLNISSIYLKKEQSLKLKVRQSYPDIKNSGPLHIPVLINFLFTDTDSKQQAKLIELKKEEETFIFKDLKTEPVLSLLQNFSAPVKIHYKQNLKDLLCIMNKDVDLFNKWEASQILFYEKILNQYDKKQNTSFSSKQINTELLLQAFESNLKKAEKNPLFFTYLLKLPDFLYVSQAITDLDPVVLDQEINNLYKQLANHSEQTLLSIYNKLIKNPTNKENRSLLNLCLLYLNHLNKQDYSLLADTQIKTHSKNMTLSMGGLQSLILNKNIYQEDRLKDFYQKWKTNSLVINNWFSLKTSCQSNNLIAEVEKIFNDKYFLKNNPNHLRALFSGFIKNKQYFYKKNANSYKYILSKILDLDKSNPLSSAALINNFNFYKRLDKDRRKIIFSELSMIKKNNLNLSKNLTEKIDNLLK